MAGATCARHLVPVGPPAVPLLATVVMSSDHTDAEAARSRAVGQGRAAAGHRGAEVVDRRPRAGRTGLDRHRRSHRRVQPAAEACSSAPCSGGSAGHRRSRVHDAGCAWRGGARARQALEMQRCAPTAASSRSRWCCGARRAAGILHRVAVDVPSAARVEIERQREALRQSEKLTAMGSLLAGVAHELNNPLAIVMGRARPARSQVRRRRAARRHRAHPRGRRALRAHRSHLPRHGAQGCRGTERGEHQRHGAGRRRDAAVQLPHARAA